MSFQLTQTDKLLAVSIVPEPASLGLLSVAAAWGLSRRRRCPRWPLTFPAAWASFPA